MNIQNIISCKEYQSKGKAIILLIIMSILIVGITVSINKSISTGAGVVDFFVLSSDKAIPPLDLPIETRLEWEGLTADQIIGRYKKGQIRREFPEQFLDETIEAIEEAAKTGDRMARKAMKLLTNKRFDKDDNRK